MASISFSLSLLYPNVKLLSFAFLMMAFGERGRVYLSGKIETFPIRNFHFFSQHDVYTISSSSFLLLLLFCSFFFLFFFFYFPPLASFPVSAIWTHRHMWVLVFTTKIFSFLFSFLPFFTTNNSISLITERASKENFPLIWSKGSFFQMPFRKENEKITLFLLN